MEVVGPLLVSWSVGGPTRIDVLSMRCLSSSLVTFGTRRLPRSTFVFTPMFMLPQECVIFEIH